MCLNDSEVRAVVQTTEVTADEFLAHNGFAAMEQALQQTAWASVAVDLQTVGPGLSAEDVVHSLEAANQALANTGCVKPARLPSGVEAQTTLSATQISLSQSLYHSNYAIIQNTDPAVYSQDIIGQEVYFHVPFSIGINHNAMVGFCNNGWTDMDDLLQACVDFWAPGVYANGLCQVGWAEASSNYYQTDYKEPSAVPCIPGHSYILKVYRKPTDSKWYQYALDINTGVYGLHKSFVSGDHLVLDANTSVFVENWNDNANWYSGFSNPWQVSNASSFRKSTNAYSPWGGEYHIFTNALYIPVFDNLKQGHPVKL